MSYTLLGPAGLPFESEKPGELGGHRKTRIYGKLDCRAALAAILRRKNAGGGYLQQRVFFRDEDDAIAAGFRPCAVCLPQRYARWKLKSRRAG